MPRGRFNEPFLFPQVASYIQRIFQQYTQYRTSIQHNATIRYTMALVAVFVAWVIRDGLHAHLGQQSPLLIFLFAVLVAGWYGGLGPGIAATVLGALVGTHFFIEPITDLSLSPAAKLNVGIFVIEGVLVSVVNEALFNAYHIITNVLESIADGFIALDTKWRFTYINQKAEKIIGRPIDLVVGKRLLEEFPELEDTVFYQQFALAARTRKPATFEAFYVPLNKWFEVHVYPGVGGLSIYFNDVTTRQVAEQESQRNFRLFNAVLESTYDGVSVKDRQGSYLFINRAGAALLRLPADEVIGHTDRELLKPEVSDHIVASDQAVIETGQLDVHEEKITTIDGEQTYLVTKSPLKDYQGTTAGVITLCHNITELKAQEQRKDDFMSIASHELKTPITSLKVFLDVMMIRAQQPPHQPLVEYLTKMKTQVDKLTKLVNELLDVSRMQAGKIQFAFEPFDLNELLKETVESLQATMGRHPLVIKGTAPALVVGDRDRIGQVLINLITNAVKYTPEADRVMIAVTADTQVARVAVQDFGIGIAPESQDKIFQRFYQVGDHSPNTYPGLGMGLYIASEIVKRHGGRIWVKSKLGAGSTFTFSIPLA